MNGGLTFFFHTDLNTLLQTTCLTLPPVVFRNATLVVVRTNKHLGILHTPPANK